MKTNSKEGEVRENGDPKGILPGGRVLKRPRRFTVTSEKGKPGRKTSALVKRENRGGEKKWKGGDECENHRGENRTGSEA